MRRPSRLALRTVQGLHLVTAFTMLLAGVARADPCDAPLPSMLGAHFSGTVVYVGDGDSICVGRSGDPRSWVEVRLADFDAPEMSTPDGKRAKAMVAQLLKGKMVACAVVRGRSGRTRSHDRVLAICNLNGVPLGEYLRRQRVPRGGR